MLVADDPSAVAEVEATCLEEAKQKFEFFWKSDSPFSQWHTCKFTVDGETYNCAEQYMMHQKARLFGDEETAQKIMSSKKARFQKQLGRQVKNFDQETWKNSCMDIVKKGNLAKFSHNDELRSTLLATHPKVLVEASPFDQIWGIGCTEDDPAAWNRKEWRGTNLLGFALTDVREGILNVERDP